MWASFKYSLLQLVRVPGVLIWTLVFPIVLGSLFVMMLGALDERAEAVSVNVVVVDEEQAKGEERSALSFENIARAAQAGAQVGSVFDEEAFGEQAFATFMEALGEGDDALFNITYVSSPEEAAALVRESLGADDEYAGYVQYADGEVQTVLAKATSASEAYEVEPSILMMIMDRYVAEEALIKETLQKNPAALANPEFIETLMAPVEATVRASVTDNAPRESLRYYFALFGMAAFFGASIGLIGFQQIRANASALAARRSLGALSHGKTAFVTLLASWLLSFASLLVLFAFLVVIGGVDFGDRVGICILICLVASLCATALGCALAAIPKVSDQAKGGIVTGIVCVASLFAGLYGTFAMDFADAVSQTAPWLDVINPVVQVCQAFYATMYYDTYAQTFGHLAILLVMALIFFALSARSLRRKRYASL